MNADKTTPSFVVAGTKNNLPKGMFYQILSSNNPHIM